MESSSPDFEDSEQVDFISTLFISILEKWSLQGFLFLCATTPPPPIVLVKVGWLVKSLKG